MRCLVALIAAAGAGCADGSTGSLLAGPRVVAVIAEPPVLATDATARLVAVTAIDGTPAVPDAAAWRACDPARIVVDPLRDCTGDAALPLAADGAGGAIFDAAAVVARFGGWEPPAGDDPCGRALVPVDVVVELELGGARLVARKQVRLGAAPPLRRNPVLSRVTADGGELVDGAVVAAGAPLAISADLAVEAIDLVCTDGADAPSVPETTRVFLYPGAGDLGDDSFVIASDAGGVTIAGTLEWTPLEPADRVPLWWIAVDPDGGVGVARREVRVE